MANSIIDHVVDLVVARGPRLIHWPVIASKTFSTLCSKFGLNVAVIGPPHLKVIGFIPADRIGGTVIAQDPHGRIHRYTTKSFVKIVSPFSLPLPFRGWLSPIVRTLDRDEYFLECNPHASFSSNEQKQSVAILGVSNRSILHAIRLLENNTQNVYLIHDEDRLSEYHYPRLPIFETLEIRFRSLGGHILTAKALELEFESEGLWNFRIRDKYGVRILEIHRLVYAATSFSSPHWAYKEYPEHSLNFEFSTLSGKHPNFDQEGWALELEFSTLVSCIILKNLVSQTEKDKKEELERIFRRTKGRIKRYHMYLNQDPWLKHSGKWLDFKSKTTIQESPGLPVLTNSKRISAHIECVTPIACNRCEQTCPEQAITILRSDPSSPGSKKPAFAGQIHLNSDKCTGCGLCLLECPSKSIHLERDEQGRSNIRMGFAVPGITKPESDMESFARETKDQGVDLFNRKGDLMIRTRAQEVQFANQKTSIVFVDLPAHLRTECTSAVMAQVQNMDHPSKLKKKPLLVNGKRITLFEDPDRTTELAPNLVDELVQCSIRPESWILNCRDGSCGLCEVTHNGIRKAACQIEIQNTELTSGFNQIEMETVPSTFSLEGGTVANQNDPMLCPCLGISVASFEEQVKPELKRTLKEVLERTKCGQGKCAGSLCAQNAYRIFAKSNQTKPFVMWNFPWRKWKL